MDDRQQFKLAFFERCASCGLSAAEAQSLLAKQASPTAASPVLAWLASQGGRGLDVLTGWTKSFGNAAIDNAFGYGVPAVIGTAAAIPLAAGAAVGGASALAGSLDDEDVKEIRQREKTELYESLARQAKRQAEIRRRRLAAAAPRRPLL